MTPSRLPRPFNSAASALAEAAVDQLGPHLLTLEQTLTELRQESDPDGTKWPEQWAAIGLALSQIHSALAPVSEAAESRPPLDPVQIAVLREEGLLESLTSLFEEMVQRTFAGMRSALAGCDAKALADAAHLLKGSAVNFGAEAFAATCQRIEQGASAMDQQLLEECLNELDTNHRELMAALHEEIRKG